MRWWSGLVHRVQASALAVLGPPILVVALAASTCLVTVRSSEAQVDPERPAADKVLPSRMRGTNAVLGTRSDIDPAAEIPRWSSWDVNVVRVVLNVDQNSTVTPTTSDPLAPYQANLVKLDKVLAQSRIHGLKAIIAVNDSWQRRNTDFWKSNGTRYRDHVTELWRALATRYRSNPTVVGYDILNEPDPTGPDIASWNNDLLPKSITAIRGIDGFTWLIVEPVNIATPGGLSSLPTITDPRVIYSIHCYAPYTFTLQGILKDCPRGPAYPGQAGFTCGAATSAWGKEQLRAWLQRAVDFQQQRGARIYVGEFGAARWAPGAAQWLGDQISLYEEYGWDWSFFSTANWNGFNPTFAADAPQSGEAYGGQSTDRFQVVRSAWAKNPKFVTQGGEGRRTTNESRIAQPRRVNAARGAVQRRTSGRAVARPAPPAPPAPPTPARSPGRSPRSALPLPPLGPTVDPVVHGVLRTVNRLLMDL
jgi:endoglucanase